MSDKTVYGWNAKYSAKGLQLVAMVDGEHVHDSPLRIGKPIEVATKEWSNLKSIKEIENGTHWLYNDDPEIIQRTKKWIETRHPLAIITSLSKEKLEKYDTLLFESGVPFVSQKILDIMSDICPDEFEAFPTIVETVTGNSTQYYILNLTSVLQNTIDFDNSLIEYQTYEHMKIEERSEDSIMSFRRLILNENCMKTNYIGRMYEDKMEVLVSEPLVKAFRKAKVKGFKYECLEDYINQMWTPNYLRDENGQFCVDEKGHRILAY